MIEYYRNKFNSGFDENNFINFLDSIQSENNNSLDFKVNESPLFVGKELSDELIKACDDILNQLKTKEFSEYSRGGLPEKYKVPGCDEHPLFLQIDFGLVKKDEKIIPQLIELQGFPSLYAYQAYLDQKVREYFELPNNFTSYFNGQNYTSYKELFKNAVLADFDPEETILLEINPDKQKTRIDFKLTEDFTGINTVNLFDLKSKGNRLFYIKDGREINVKRIYNRMIFDELDRLSVKPETDFTKEYDVSWAGHPDWFFKISKHTLPYIKSVYSPESYLLPDFDIKSHDLSRYVLKPLYSFAGSGVKIDITENDLTNIKDKENYIVQKKVEYEPVLKTPDGYSKAEIRMMIIWIDQPVIVNNLLRTSKGKMMGVDFNKGQNWIGSNLVYHPVR